MTAVQVPVSFRAKPDYANRIRQARRFKQIPAQLVVVARRLAVIYVSRRCGESAFFNPELLDLRFQRRGGNAERGRSPPRSRDLSTTLGQGGLDHLFLLI